VEESQPIPGWRPKVGERVIIAAENWAAEVVGELPGDCFEVERDIRLDVAKNPDTREIRQLLELRPEYPTREQLAVMYP
jgi:hypothetical protein